MASFEGQSSGKRKITFDIDLNLSPKSPTEVSTKRFLFDLNRTPEDEETLLCSSVVPDHIAYLSKETKQKKTCKADDAGFTYVPTAPQKPGGQSSQSSQVETLSLTNEGLIESFLTSTCATNTDASMSDIKECSLKWMSKGKRNMRSRKHGFNKLVDDEKSNCVFQLNSEPVTETLGDEVQGKGTHILNKKPQIVPVASPQRSLPHHLSRYTVNPKYQFSEFTPRVYDPDSNLYDVNLEINSNYCPQHVPYISLMSKLTSKPVIGHPLTVEPLDGDICDLLQSSSECYGEDASHGMKMVLEGRRPNQPVGKIPRKKHYGSHRHDSASRLSKSRRNGLTSIKIRRFSSVTGSHKQSVHEKERLTPQVKGPFVSCVPLKVVFSRLNAALK